MAYTPEALRHLSAAAVKRSRLLRADAGMARLRSLELRQKVEAAEVSGAAHRVNSQAATRRNDDRQS